MTEPTHADLERARKAACWPGEQAKDKSLADVATLTVRELAELIASIRAEVELARDAKEQK